MVAIKLPNGAVIEGPPQEIAEVLRSMGSGDAEMAAKGTESAPQQLKCDKCHNDVRVYPDTGWGLCKRCSRWIEPPGVAKQSQGSEVRVSSDPRFNCGKDKDGFVLNDLGIRQEYPGGPWVFG